MKQNTIKMKNLLMYGLGDIYGGSSFFIIGTLFMIYLTDVVGLSPVKAGAVFIIGKIWDAISDPLMGYISDRTQTRYGKRRVYFLIGMLPAGLTFMLLWLPVNFVNQNFTFIYYTFAYILFCSVFTMLMIPYAALNAEMSHDYRQRTRLSGARMIFSQVATLLSGVLPNVIINQAASPAQGHLIMGVAFGVLYTLPWLFVYFGTWELENTRQQTSEVTYLDLFKNFLTTFNNRSFRIHLAMYLCAYSAMDILMAVFAYYMTYYLRRPDLFSIALGSMLLAQISSLPFYVYMSNRKGSGRAYMLGVSIWGGAMLLLSQLSSSSPTALIVLNCVFIGAGLSAGVMVPWAILPSVIDVDELITGRKRAGVYSGMMTLIRKTVQAVVVFLVGITLTAIGYVPNVEQSTETLFKMRLLFILGPICLITIGVISASRFKITSSTHAVLMKELNRLRNGGKHADVSHSAKEVCEEMTGIQYQDLYDQTA